MIASLSWILASTTLCVTYYVYINIRVKVNSLVRRNRIERTESQGFVAQTAIELDTNPVGFRNLSRNI